MQTPPPLLRTVGYVRSSLTLALAVVVWNPADVDQYSDRNKIGAHGVYMEWDSGPPRWIGNARTEAEARQCVGEAKREEARRWRKGWTGGRRKLCHDPAMPPVIDR